MQQLWFINNPLAQHVLGSIMPIFRSARLYRTAYGFQHLICFPAPQDTSQHIKCWKPYAVRYNLALLKIGIMKPETCRANGLLINHNCRIWLVSHVSYQWCTVTWTSDLFNYVYRSSGNNLTGLPMVHNSPFHQNIQSRTRKKSHKGKFLGKLITVNLEVHKYSGIWARNVEELNLSHWFHWPVTLFWGCCSFLVLRLIWSPAVSEIFPSCVPLCLGTANVLSSEPNVISWVVLLLCNW